ncbi:MAG: gliding motility-associated C-terminal domain-containing protein [Bacteroidetes bacterium]|nr:gliding motility-associated C-terminal domain-containing protein [Bacteroidota bacterium]
MRKIYLFLILSLFSLKALSTGGYITISSTVPSSITICGQAKVFSFTINNPSAFNLTNITVSLTMPSGINYQIGSVTNATQLTTVPSNAPTFSLANLPSLTSVVITYTASADCNILNYLSLGLPTENKIQVNYTAGSNTTFDLHTTQLFFVKQPNLSITTITNQSFSGTIGGTFTRCITITNGGTGELSTFTLTDVHGNGIQITAASPGAWTSVGTTETYVLNGSNFTAIGNNNALFETGESITICETVNILNCSSVLSTFTSAWGCNAQACQTSVSTANVIFPSFVPNLVITAQPAVNPCLGTGNFSQQTLKIVNTGAGQAINTLLNIYQTSGPNYYDPSQQTEIILASITIKVNAGAPSPLAPTSTSASAAGCLSGSPKGAVELTIPAINAGDTVRISWKTQSCCNVGYGYYNGWAYNASYQSICLNNYVVPASWGQVYSQNYIFNLVNNGSPSTIIAGQTSTFNYLLNGVYNSSPALNDAYLKITFTVSPCYTYSPNTIQIINSVGTATFLPASVVQVGNVITAMFTGSPPFNSTLYSTLEQAQLLIDLTGNCASCVSGPGTIGVGIYYSPSAACTCEMLLISSNFNLNLVCPVTCTGLNFLNYDIKRTSYGAPDNNDDGLPDGFGSLNFAKIKRSRAMYGDTVTSSFYAKVKTSVANPTWQYCYANSTISNGNNLTSLGGKLRIYRLNALFATCNINSVAAALPATTFNYDLSATALIASGGVSPGFVFINNDSLIFEPQYKVTTNIGGAILPSSTTNTFIVSDIPNPTNPVNIFSCNTFQGNFSIIGYYYTNYGPNSYNVTDCNQAVITQNYYLSIGPCCSNYAGGNLFPFEYRNWARIDTLKTVLPAGYKFVAASFYDTRTMGTFNASSSPVFTIAPISAATNTLVFPVGSFFTSASVPSITPSDDGFYGVFSATIEPSCGVIQNVAQNIGYYWTFKPSGYLPSTTTLNVSNDNTQDAITYVGPSIFLQSPLPFINATSNVVSWDISLSNTTNSPANSTWFSVPTISGITINTVVDLSTSATLTPVGGIYQLGTFPSSTIKNYRLYGTYTSCAQDSIIVHAGWNCQGYPVILASYPCITKKITLKSTPQSPLLITNVITPSTIINLCDTASYEVIGTNVQLGSVYNLTVNVNIPVGVIIIPGSSQLSYPIINPYVTISDPIFIGGTTYQYNISVASPSIGANGLPGILSVGNNAVKIKFKVRTTCGYTSGSLASFSFFGVSGCGASTGQLVSLSSQLGIAGASIPYTTNTVLKSTFISPCNNASVLRVSSQNLGPLSFGNSDSIRVILPYGVSYVAASFAGISNPPVNTIPSITIINNTQNLAWKLPTGIAPNDSTVFNINYTGNPIQLACNISNFEAKTTSSSALLCTLTNSFCGVQVVTGGDTLPIFTYKSYLTLINAGGYSVPNPPTGETGYVNFTINNTGQTLNSSNSTVISYYNDVNSNGIYNVGDILITTHTLNAAIPSNGTYAYNYTLNIPSGAACHLIAVLDTAINHCSCNASQIVLNLPLRKTAIDTSICPGQTAIIGYNPITNYSYSWTPVTNLSSGTISNPLVTGVNATTSNITTNYIVTVNRNTCLSNDTAVVIIKPNPTLSITPTNTTICFGNSANVSVSGANSYTWLPSATLNNSISPTVIANPTLTTTYTVTGLAINGCSSSSVTAITVNPLPNVTATSNTICTLQSGTIAANGAINYTWTPAATLSSNTASNVTANPLTTTVYSVTGMDINGCLKTSTTTVFVNPLPNVAATSNTICTLLSGTLAASGAVNYTWAPSGTLNNSVTANVTASPTVTTVYTITGVDANGCLNINTSTVVVNPLPNVAATSNTICTLLSGTLAASGAVNYTWTPAATLNNSLTANVTANPTVTTVYTITGVDANGCMKTNTTQVIVNPLPNVTASNATICLLQSTSISANGATNYTWSPATALSSSITPSVTANPLVTTIYTVTGMDANGCIKTNTASVLVNPLPNVAATSNTICFSQSAPISASGAVNYTWSPSATLNNSTAITVTASPLSTTVYSITGMDANGCVKTNTTIVVVNPLPNLTVTSNTMCFGSSALLTINGASGYTWTPSNTLSNPNNPTVTATPTISTTYTISGVSPEGCFSATTTSVLVNPLPVLSTSDHTICYGNSANVSVSGATNYTWTPPTNLNTTNQPNVIATPIQNTTYSVTGQDINGCKSSTISTVIVNLLPIITITSPSVICAGQSALLSSSGASTYVWSNASVLSSQFVSPVTPTTYSVIGTDGNGCVNTGTVFLNVLIQPTLTISGTQTVCLGNTLNLTAHGGINYTWDTGDSTTTIIVAPPANTTYTVSAGIAPCNSSTVFAVVVYTPQSVTAYAQPPKIIYGSSSTLFGNGAPGNTYAWSPSFGINCNNCDTNTVAPASTTIYTVTITDNNGCLVTNTVIVEVDIICGDAFVPSAFSPNNDGFNDFWCVYGNCITSMNIQLYNRWGEKVFESEDRSHCWDGTYNGVMQNDAVFIYQLTAEFVNGEKIVKKGNVTLSR